VVGGLKGKYMREAPTTTFHSVEPEVPTGNMVDKESKELGRTSAKNVKREEEKVLTGLVGPFQEAL